MCIRDSSTIVQNLGTLAISVTKLSLVEVIPFSRIIAIASKTFSKFCSSCTSNFPRLEIILGRHENVELIPSTQHSAKFRSIYEIPIFFLKIGNAQNSFLCSISKYAFPEHKTKLSSLSPPSESKLLKYKIWFS